MVLKEDVLIVLIFKNQLRKKMLIKKNKKMIKLKKVKFKIINVIMGLRQNV